MDKVQKPMILKVVEHIRIFHIQVFETKDPLYPTWYSYCARVRRQTNRSSDLGGMKNFYFSMLSKRALGSTEFPIQ
jgi:hypothetical protein